MKTYRSSIKYDLLICFYTRGGSMSKGGKYLIALVIIIAVILVIVNVRHTKKDESGLIEKYKQSLIKADNDFYIYSSKNGTGRAFIDFADDSVILLRQQQFPIVSKNELIKHYLNNETKITPLKWTPIKAEVSLDGSMGFTYGKWEYTNIDKSGKKSTSYGNYVTIWKKQMDGTWKYVLDGGTDTPPPASSD
jgi:ketosteroid isomerase-like protein